MKQIYTEQWRLFKQSYLKSFTGLLILFIVTGIGVYIAMLNNETAVIYFMDQVEEMFREKGLLGRDLTPAEAAVMLLQNNAAACIALVLTGFIPIFLPTVVIIMLNSAIMGVLFAFIKLNGQAVLPTLLAGILPHGIFEIPAIILSGSLAFTISTGIYKKINDPHFPFKKCLAGTGKTFLFVCIPLLIIAALVEAMITPVLLKMIVTA